MFPIHRVTAWTVLAIGLASVAEVSAQISYSTLALSGQPAPDLPAGVIYADFSSPHISDAGQTMYRAILSGDGVTTTNSVAIYADKDPAPRLLARSGDAAPGLAPGETLFTVNTPAPGAVDQFAYHVVLTGPGVSAANEAAIYAGGVSSTQLVARGGAAAPGVPAGVVYASTFHPVVNDSNELAYLATLAGSGVSGLNDRAIYAGPFSAPQLVAREGAVAPSLAPGVNYGSPGLPTLNAASQVAYFSFLSGSGVTFSNDEAIFAGAPSAPQLVARAGDPALGTPAGVRLSLFSFSIALNDAGQVAYAASLTGIGVDTSNSNAFYAGPIASPQLIARGGEPAPGAGAGVAYAMLHDLLLNDVGGVSYSATLTGAGITSANSRAIFAGAMNDPQLIVRSDDAAPGTAAGVNFLNPLMRFLNDQGQVVFTSELTGAGVSPANDRGLFFFDPALGAALIAREGDLFDVGGGDLRTIADDGISVAFGDIRFPSGFSDNGLLAFKLKFTDGASGVFIATLVPEPGSLALVALGLAISGVAWARCRNSKYALVSLSHSSAD
ncbi:MAG: PEP-CTERM sorting domain-containing protein [Pirellulales bacterium]|nr:PEP-CTERM sorting domain-containing protein [Pirellulales bacterium]